MISINARRGFTIVELLIVVVIIAILAAITVVAYNDIQNRTNDSVVRSDIAMIRKKLEMVKIDIGHYPRSYAEFPSDMKISKGSYDTTANNVYYITDTVNDTYAFGLRSKSLYGFILTNTGLQENIAVNGAATATTIGVAWGDTGTVGIVGYSSSAGAWTTTWTVTN